METDLDALEPAATEAAVERVRQGFWPKVRSVLGHVPFVPDAVAMYYAMLDLRTPFWVKGMVATALLYFIAPIDAVPDILAVTGYADDATLLFMTLNLIHGYVRPEHLRKAMQAMGMEEPEGFWDDRLVERVVLDHEAPEPTAASEAPEEPEPDAW